MWIFVILINDAGTEPRDSVRPRRCKQRRERTSRLRTVQIYLTQSCRNVARYVSACSTSIFSSTSFLSLSSLPVSSNEFVIAALPFLHAGNHVRAAEPVRFGQISRRPARRMVGMRMIEPDDVLSALPAFPLDANQFAWIDVIAILRRIRTRVAAAGNGCHGAHFPVHLAEQNPTALVGISLLAVLAKSVVILALDLQHKNHLPQRHRVTEKFKTQFVSCLCDSVSLWWNVCYSCQNLSLKYLSPESHRIVTKTARSFFFSCRASCRQPTTAAAADIPTSKPSSRARRLAMA